MDIGASHQGRDHRREAVNACVPQGRDASCVRSVEVDARNADKSQRSDGQLLVASTDERFAKASFGRMNSLLMIVALWER